MHFTRAIFRRPTFEPFTRYVPDPNATHNAKLSILRMLGSYASVRRRKGVGRIEAPPRRRVIRHPLERE